MLHAEGFYMRKGARQSCSTRWESKRAGMTPTPKHEQHASSRV